MGYPPIAARSTGPQEAWWRGAACSRSETLPPMQLTKIAARYAAQRMISTSATYQLDRTARSLGEATGVADAMHLSSDVVTAWVAHERIAAQIGLAVTPQQLRRSSISEVERQRPGAGHRHAGHTTDGTTQRWYFDHEYIYGDVRGPRANR